jgi:hypothetical protein
VGPRGRWIWGTGMGIGLYVQADGGAGGCGG